MRSFPAVQWMFCLTLTTSLGMLGCTSQPSQDKLSNDAAKPVAVTTTAPTHVTAEPVVTATPITPAKPSTVATNAGEFTRGATMLAHYTSTPVKLDGKLTEPIWQTATAYLMFPLRKYNVPNFELQETTTVRLAWDENYFYVAGELNDVDIVDNNKADQQHLYSFGDTMELFLKPSTRKWYWEFYGTPSKHKSTLFYPSRGRFGLNPFPFQPSSGLKVAVSINGTLNNWQDDDKGYFIEMAIPLKDLNLEGQGLLAKDVQWSILVSRYNYSAKTETFQAELSSVPKLKRVNFHIYETWAKLKLVK